MTFIYVPYDPCDARTVEASTERSAIRWFREMAGTNSRARANLNTTEGKVLATYADGEFYNHTKESP
jgi:hypothetical protein